MKIIPFKSKKKKKDRIETVKENNLKRIDSFNKHFSKKTVDDSSIQFFHIARLFFADFFKIRYEFTFEELEKELKRKKIDNDMKEKIAIFLKKISAVEYSDEKLSRSEIKPLFEEFKNISKRLTHKKEKTERRGFFSFLKNIFSKKQKEEKKEKSTKNKNSFLLKLNSIVKNKRKKKIHKMLLKELELVNQDKIEEGKNLYLKIKKKYNLLDEDDKKNFYSALSELEDLFQEFENLRKRNKKVKLPKEAKPLLNVKSKTVNTRKKKIQDMIIKASELVKKDKINEAKRFYVNIKKEYETLDNDDKKELYSDILALYNKIISNKR